MNCADCRENLAAHLEGLLSAEMQRGIARHLQACSACRTEAEADRRLRERLLAGGKGLSPVSLPDAVMILIDQRRETETRRIAMRKRIRRTGMGLAAAAAIAAAFLIPWPGSDHGRAQAAEVLEQALQAWTGLHSVHIRLNARTLPRDNFELICLDCDFVPHDLWKQFGETPRWRVEKPGRVVVMDGEAATLLIRDPRPDGTGGMAASGSPDAGFVTWMKLLLDVNLVLESELRSSRLSGWATQVTSQTGTDGALKLVVSIEAKAQGDFTHDWLRNKSISASDHLRVYHFDAATLRLEDLEVWVHENDRDVLVLDVDEIVFNPEIQPDLFALDLPPDVIWFQEPQVLPEDEDYARLSPVQTARAFFQACADEDWDEVLKFWPASEVDGRMKEHLGGLQVITIGESFQSGQYPGWFVPYEIRLRSGTIRKHNLAVRNDNPAQRYVVDGGI